MAAEEFGSKCVLRVTMILGGTEASSVNRCFIVKVYILRKIAGHGSDGARMQMEYMGYLNGS
jgi:hypothetical protein